MYMRIASSILLLWFALVPLSTIASPSSQIPPATQSITKKLGLKNNEIAIHWNDKLGTPSLLQGSLSSPSGHSPQWIAYGFLNKLRSTYGLRDPKRDLQIVDLERTADLNTNLKLQQMLFNTPVYGATLTVRIDHSGIVRLVEGTIYPHLERTLFNRATHPVLSPKQAKQIALQHQTDKDAYVRQEPDVRLYYYPLRGGTQLIYEVTFQPADSAELARTKVHALMGHVIP
ncbi:hypothetical protein [Paenibacillus sp. CF384]|uniref:hypothetical protein n=1 Tax=Paenibacillus sp. CF384 TaxID=1884382 RepID=UPI0008999B6C|nr:hypothetical protein [Paenibacillus sp. CF384]SDX71952.1 hypothetical protein SAMN05518855_1019110 [Paenibacillus sp. CF384]